MFRLPKERMAIPFAILCFLLFGVPTRAQEMPSDYQEVLKSLDRKGDFKAGVLKVNIPRNDLKMTIQGVPTPTPFGFGGWIAFTKTSDGSEVMMGDLVLLQEEVNPVMSALLDHGIDITALHNHFFWDDPHVFYMHVHSMGKAPDLAQHVKPALDLIGHVKPVAAAPASSGGAPIDTAKIAKIVGHEGELSGSVYKITIGRDDLGMKEHGAVINARMGLNTWAAFVGTQEDAVVAGDVAMLESEVTPILKVLSKNGLDVVAIHHHMVEDRPVVIFLHYWGQGPADKLAGGFKAALDELGKGGSAQGMAAQSGPSTEDADIASAVKVTAQKDCGCGQCAAKGCDPCKGKNCHYCVAKALVVKECGCGGCSARGCAICGPGCDVCKFHLAPSAASKLSPDSTTDKPN
jgi:hypothetical protein